ncbi:MAG: SDR family NAD(P)-dependent oxidoreductase [Aureispira sp.]|nr:SDR family NAD(P)-dependent oxidoreductase [Aureispira sp.]
MQKQVAIVTGASSGIGKGVAKKLVQEGIAVVLVNRDSEKARLVQEELKTLNPEVSVELISTDLSSMQSVRNFVDSFQKKHSKLDFLFACAGVLTTQRQVTVDGLEQMFATNYLGHFLLINLLLEQLKKAKSPTVLIVSGRGHKPTWLEGRKAASIDFEDLQGKKKFSFVKAAKQAVLARVLLTYGLAQRWKKENISVATVCPGLVKTALTRHFSFPLNQLAKLNFWLRGAHGIEQAGENLYQLASSYNIHGKYFEVSNKTKQVEVAHSSALSYDEAVADQLWTVSEELLGQEFRY